MSQNLFGNKDGAGRGLTMIAILIALPVGIFAGGPLYSWWTSRNARANAPMVEEGEPEEAHASGVVALSEQAQRNGGIRIAATALRSIRTTLSATGVVSPDQTRVAHIRPIARGLVEKVHVRLGDRVSAGDPLIEYDNIELGLAIGEYLSARAELQGSLTDLDVKRKILARSAKMLEVGAVAQTTYDIREAEVRDAEAKVNSARAVVTKVEEQIHRFGTTDDELANLNREEGEKLHRTESHSTLPSPFYGVVTSYDVAEGELMEPSDELMTITDLSSVWVQADVYEKDLGHVKLGHTVDVRVASYPDEIFHGKITYISDVIEPMTRTAKVRCVVSNRNSRLKLDMFAAIEIPTLNAREVMAVPSTAIQQVDGRPVVFIKRSGTEFEKRDIEMGVEDQGWVEIKSGLGAGDEVVTAGSFYMKSALLRGLIGEDE